MSETKQEIKETTKVVSLDVKKPKLYGKHHPTLSNFLILSNDGREFWVSSFILSKESSLFKSMFESMEGLMGEGIKEDKTGIQIENWLKAFHEHDDMKLATPTKEIGSFILLCEKYDMSKLVQPIKVDTLTPDENHDLVKVACNTKLLNDYQMETIKN